MNKKRRNKTLAFFLLVGLTLIFILSGCGDATSKTKSLPESIFEMHFLNVDQGDSILVICNDEAMLIDGGPADKSDLVYSYLKEKKIDHLKYIIATHPEEDHVGGLSGALNYATADAAYTSKIEKDKEAFNSFLEYLDKQKVNIQIPSNGTSFLLGIANVTVFHPEDLNERNASLVIRIEYGETSFLLMGDAEETEEQELLKSGAIQKSTVLKVGHHGAETSTTENLLNAVMPEAAVISCGQKNLYGHPADATLSRLHAFGVKLYRTDMQGHIVCTSDGHKFTFTPEKNADADTYLTYYELYEQETTSAGALKAGAAGELEEGPTEAPKHNYILNTNTYKFHYPSCKSVNQMKDYNKMEYYGTREDVIGMGYSPCGNCHP